MASHLWVHWVHSSLSFPVDLPTGPYSNLVWAPNTHYLCWPNRYVTGGSQ